MIISAVLSVFWWPNVVRMLADERNDYIRHRMNNYQNQNTGDTALIIISEQTLYKKIAMGSAQILKLLSGFDQDPLCQWRS